MRRCHHCDAEWISDKKQPAVKETCPECSAYLHCCVNCRFYEPGSHNDCAVGTTDWVGDKEGCNFCDDFEFAIADTTIAGGETPQEAREAFEKFFGHSAAKKDEERLKDFNKLFGD